MEWITAVIRQLTGAGWYGKLIISIENGRITLVKKEETLKPPKQ